MKRALIVVDMQVGFSEDGELPVIGASELVPVINSLMREFDIRIASKDTHPENHCSFKEHGGPWPPHCVAWTDSWEFIFGLNSYMLDKLVEKATAPKKDAYSAFDGTDLEKILRMLDVTELHICGLATDYCVKATALDAVELGFKTYVIIDACRAVDPKTGFEAVEDMKQAGVKITSFSQYGCC